MVREHASQTTDPTFLAHEVFRGLELKESRELFGMSEEIEIGANQVLFGKAMVSGRDLRRR